MVTKPRKIGPKWPGPKVLHKKNAKMCFSPRGSILSFEGGILLSISLGLAVRIFWIDFGDILGGGPFWGKKCSGNVVLWRNGFVVGV